MNAGGESLNSSTASIKPLGPAPRNLTAASVSRSQINLAWFDESSDETGFKVEIKTSSSSWREIGTVPADTTAVAVTGLSRRTTYYFRVRAYNASGNTAYSNTASAKTKS